MLTKEMITALCSRMKDDCSTLCVDATFQIAEKCNLNGDQCADVAVVISTITRDIVKRSMDLCIELATEESLRFEKEASQ